MAHIAWLGKKSPFCGNVTYGLTTTHALKSRGHGISFIHFDTPAAGQLGFSAPGDGEASGRLHTGGRQGNTGLSDPNLDPQEPEVALLRGMVRQLRWAARQGTP